MVWGWVLAWTRVCTFYRNLTRKYMRKIIPYPDPPPLCKKHNRPITPYRWRMGCRNTSCSKCGNADTRSDKNKIKRSNKWNLIYIPCRCHPDRRCNRSAYASLAVRKCASCCTRGAGGKFRLGRLRNRKKHCKRWGATFRGKILNNARYKRYHQRKALGWAPSLAYAGQKHKVFN